MGPFTRDILECAFMPLPGAQPAMGVGSREGDAASRAPVSAREIPEVLPPEASTAH